MVDDGGKEETKGEDANTEAAKLKAKPHHYSYPKVLIMVKSELLFGNGDYTRHFLPLESQNKDKDEEREAVDDEMRRLKNKRQSASRSRSPTSGLSGAKAQEVAEVRAAGTNYRIAPTSCSQSNPTFQNFMVDCTNVTLASTYSHLHTSTPRPAVIRIKPTEKGETKSLTVKIEAAEVAKAAIAIAEANAAVPLGLEILYVRRTTSAPTPFPSPPS